jgi:diguanylate cyclase (GGDEF)-like protein
MLLKQIIADAANWPRLRTRLSRLTRLIHFRVNVLIRRFLTKGKSSLVNRLLGLLLMGTTIICLVAVIGLWWTSSRLIEDSLHTQALQWIADIDELGVPLYISRGKVNLSVVASRLKNFPEISFVRYYDASGAKILREYVRRSDQVIPKLTGTQLEELERLAGTDESYLFDSRALNGAYFRIISPVRIKSIRSDGLLNFDLARHRPENVKVVGYIDLGIDRSFHQARLARTIGLGSSITGVIFLIALFGGRRLIKKALAPLMDLQTPLARLAKGEIGVSVATRGDKEIVAIGNALNVTIGALKERDEILRKLAEHDSLTGLFNRNYFSGLLKNEILRVARDGVSSALLFIDLDRFKYVNDMLGHGVGDILLVRVADLIKGRMRENDAVSRFGGDEFTVMARNVSKQGAIDVARVINEITSDFHFVEQGQTFNVSCSVGVAMITADCAGPEEIFSQADAACYEAKSCGRNCYHIYEPDQKEVTKTITDVDRSQLIKQALKTNGFRLVYQPIVSVSGGQKEYYEVLLRLPTKEGDVFLPGAFLPMAERFGLLAAIDRWVIMQALQALMGFRGTGRDITFAINLSGQTFTDPSLAELIKDLLHRYDIPPAAVIFEITEQVAVRYLDKTRSLMQDLIGMGCRFALDDFGVGFSSFNYLKRLPVSFIKIDGCFVENLTSQAVDQAMVKSIVQIAKALNIETVAEFVQDSAAVNLLRDYGVDYLQGYFIGKPSDVLTPHTKKTIITHTDQDATRPERKL